MPAPLPSRPGPFSRRVLDIQILTTRAYRNRTFAGTPVPQAWMKLRKSRGTHPALVRIVVLANNVVSAKPFVTVTDITLTQTGTYVRVINEVFYSEKMNPDAFSTALARVTRDTVPADVNTVEDTAYKTLLALQRRPAREDTVDRHTPTGR